MFLLLLWSVEYFQSLSMQGIGLGKYSEFEIVVGYKCRKNVLMKLLADIYRLENEGFLLENSIMTHAGHS